MMGEARLYRTSFKISAVQASTKRMMMRIQKLHRYRVCVAVVVVDAPTNARFRDKLVNVNYMVITLEHALF